MKHAPAIPFLIIGVALFAIGASGRRGFVAIGTAFLVIGVAFLVRQRRAGRSR